jgi:hypothetical protein
MHSDPYYPKSFSRSDVTVLRNNPAPNHNVTIVVPSIYDFCALYLQSLNKCKDAPPSFF